MAIRCAYAIRASIAAAYHHHVFVCCHHLIGHRVASHHLILWGQEVHGVHHAV